MNNKKETAAQPGAQADTAYSQGQPAERAAVSTSSECGGFLSGAVLKYTAMVSMVIDHTAAACIARMAAREWVWASGARTALYIAMRCAGRLAFPVFLFCLCEGFFHTRDRKKHAALLAVFAFASQIPYSGALLRPGGGEELNTLFELLSCFIMLWILEHIKARNLKPCLRAVLSAALIMLFCILTSFFSMDYSWGGVLLAAVFYFLRDKRAAAACCGAAVMFFDTAVTSGAVFAFFTLPAFALIYLYSGRKGRQPKLLFYIFYPAHLVLLWMLRRAVFGA